MSKEPQDKGFIPESIDEQIEFLSQTQEQDTHKSRLVRDLQALYGEKSAENQTFERINKPRLVKEQSIAYGEESAEDRAFKRIGGRLSAYIAEAQSHGPQEQRQPVENQRMLEQERDFQMQTQVKTQHIWTRPLTILAAVLTTTLVVGSLIAVLQMTRANGNNGETTSSGKQQNPTKSTGEEQTSPGMYIGVNNQVIKVDIQTKKILWRFAVEPDPKDIPAFQQPGIYNQPIVENGSVYFSAQNGRLYALNAQTGTLLWQRNFQMEVGNIYVANDVLYTNTDWSDAHGTTEDVYAINPKNGQTQVQYKTTGQIAGLIDNILYIINKHNLIAIKVSDGSQLWQTNFAATQQLNEEVHARNGVLYVSSAHISMKQPNEPQDSYVYTINMQSGKITWQSPPMNGFVFNSTVDDQGYVYCGAQNHYVYAFDPQTNKQLWRYNTPDGYVYPAPIVHNGTVYVRESINTNRLIALNATTGTQKWIQPLTGYNGTNAIEPLVLHNGVIYLGTSDGIQGISASTGKEVMTITASTLLNWGPGVDGFITGMAITIVS